jgi:S-DNA-T family DNA segregation ATPase FtsK/SpoIIIE
LVFPRWIQYQILPAVGSRISKITGLAEELALALDSETCRISRKGGLLAVEIPRDDPEPVRLLPLQRRLMGHAGDTSTGNGRSAINGSETASAQIPFGTAVLGLADDGVPLLLRLPSPQVAHVLVAGTTGSGKTALIRSIVTSLALRHRPSQIGFVLIDPKGRAFGSLAGLPHLLRPVLREPEDIGQVLQRLVQVMLQRDRDGCAIAGAGECGSPRVVVVIDELADLLMTTASDTQQAITRLVQRGRSAGIHIIACTQKPASRVVGSLAKANFPVRLVGRVTSPEDAKVATGYAGTGAERLQGPGDFVAVNGGQITRFQAAFISSRELVDVMRWLLTAQRAHDAGRGASTFSPQGFGNGKAAAASRTPDAVLQPAPIEQNTRLFQQRSRLTPVT